MLLCLVALAVAGCGDDGDQAGPVGHAGAAATGAPFDPDQPLDQEQVEQVLVTADDLDEDFTEESVSQESNSVMPCLAVIDDLDQFGPAAAAHAERSFSAEYDDPAQGQLFSQVASYDSVASAEEVFTAVRDHADGCGLVTDHQGDLRWKLNTQVRAGSSSQTDEQFDFIMDGVVVADKDKEIYLGHYQVARVGNTIIMVALINIAGPDPEDTVDTGFEASLGRLIDLRSPDA